MWRTSILTAVLVAAMAVPTVARDGGDARRGRGGGDRQSQQVIRGQEGWQARQQQVQATRGQNREIQRGSRAAVVERAPQPAKRAKRVRVQPRPQQHPAIIRNERPVTQRERPDRSRPAVVSERPRRVEPIAREERVQRSEARPSGPTLRDGSFRRVDRPREVQSTQVERPVQVERPKRAERPQQADRPQRAERPRPVNPEQSAEPQRQRFERQRGGQETPGRIRQARPIVREVRPIQPQEAGPTRRDLINERELVNERHPATGLQRDVQRRVRGQQSGVVRDARPNTRHSLDRPGPAAVGSGSLLLDRREPRRITGDDIARARRDLSRDRWDRDRHDRHRYDRFDRDWDRRGRDWDRHDRRRHYDNDRFSVRIGFYYGRYYGYHGWYDRYCPPVVYRPVVYRPVYCYEPAWYRPVYYGPPLIYYHRPALPIVYTYPCFAPGLSFTFNF